MKMSCGLWSFSILHIRVDLPHGTNFHAHFLEVLTFPFHGKWKWLKSWDLVSKMTSYLICQNSSLMTKGMCWEMGKIWWFSSLSIFVHRIFGEVHDCDKIWCQSWQWFLSLLLVVMVPFWWGLMMKYSCSFKCLQRMIFSHCFSFLLHYHIS